MYYSKPFVLGNTTRLHYFLVIAFFVAVIRGLQQSYILFLFQLKGNMDQVQLIKSKWSVNFKHCA